MAVVSVESRSQDRIGLTTSFPCNTTYTNSTWQVNTEHTEKLYVSHCKTVLWSLSEIAVFFVSTYLVSFSAQVTKGKWQRKCAFFKKSGLSSTYFFL